MNGLHAVNRRDPRGDPEPLWSFYEV